MQADNQPRRRAPGGGRKPKHPGGVAVQLPVRRVAPDVAALVCAEEKPTAFVEAAIRYYAQRPPSFVPAVADVLAYMQQHSLNQDDAVRALGGNP